MVRSLQNLYEILSLNLIITDITKVFSLNLVNKKINPKKTLLL